MSQELMTGAQAIIRSLELLGIDTIFGLPGGAILPTYDPLMDSKQIRHILVRHEQGAGHAAEGYASATGKLGVCIATSGPGATNLVTAIADAHMDSVPLLAITGQVGSKLIGTDAFQEADIVGITMPITKHSFLVTRAEDIPEVMASAYLIATTGRPGPVLVDVTKDAQVAKAPFVWPPKVDLPGYKPVTKAHGKQIQAAAQLIAESQKPVLYVGGGIIRSRASEELLKLAELINVPVVTTLMARGAFPDSHPQNLGMPGMHGTVPAVTSLQKSDLLITLGARFDDRVTGDVKSFAPGAKVIHVDIDPAEIGKIRFADVPIVGDLKDVITELIAEISSTQKKKPEFAEWWKFVNGLVERYPLGYTHEEDGKLSPQYVIKRIGELSGPEAIYAAGVGQHQMWSAQFVKYERPNSWLNSGGAGTMGYDGASPGHGDERHAAGGVDERGDRPTVELSGALAALKLWPKGHRKARCLRLHVHAQHADGREADEGGGVALLLQAGDGIELIGAAAHGVTTILPNTSRSSIRRSASRMSSRGSTLSTTGFMRPLRASSSSDTMSSRRQPLLPISLSSKVHT